MNKILKNRILNSSLLIGTLLIIFVAGEIILRVNTYFKDRQIIENSYLKNINKDNEYLHVNHLFILSDNDKLIYELRKNHHGKALSFVYEVFTNAGFQVTTNSDGLRDREYLIEKDKDTAQRML